MYLILDSSFRVLDSIFFWIDWNHVEALWKRTWSRMISKNSFGKQETSSKRRLSGTAENYRIIPRKTKHVGSRRGSLCFSKNFMCVCVCVFFALHKYVGVSTGRCRHVLLWHETCWCCGGFESDWKQEQTEIGESDPRQHLHMHLWQRCESCQNLFSLDDIMMVWWYRWYVMMCDVHAIRAMHQKAWTSACFLSLRISIFSASFSRSESRALSGISLARLRFHYKKGEETCYVYLTNPSRFTRTSVFTLLTLTVLS